MDLYRQAEFPENSSSLVVDKLIHSCTNRDCKKKLMAKNKNITTKACLEIMRRFESVEATMKKLGSPSDAQIDVSYATDPTKKSQKSGSRYKSHRHKTLLHNVNVSSDQESSGYEDNFDLNPVTIDAVRSRNAQELFAQVGFNTSKDGTKAFTAKGKVDTGAMVSCIQPQCSQRSDFQAMISHPTALSFVECQELTSRTVEQLTSTLRTKISQ